MPVCNIVNMTANLRCVSSPWRVPDYNPYLWLHSWVSLQTDLQFHPLPLPCQQQPIHSSLYFHTLATIVNLHCILERALHA